MPSRRAKCCRLRGQQFYFGLYPPQCLCCTAKSRDLGSEVTWMSPRFQPTTAKQKKQGNTFLPSVSTKDTVSLYPCWKTSWSLSLHLANTLLVSPASVKYSESVREGWEVTVHPMTDLWRSSVKEGRRHLKELNKERKWKCSTWLDFTKKTPQCKEWEEREFPYGIPPFITYITGNPHPYGTFLQSLWIKGGKSLGFEGQRGRPTQRFQWGVSLLCALSSPGGNFNNLTFVL